MHQISMNARFRCKADTETGSTNACIESKVLFRRIELRTSGLHRRRGLRRQTASALFLTPASALLALKALRFDAVTVPDRPYSSRAVQAIGPARCRQVFRRFRGLMATSCESDRPFSHRSQPQRTGSASGDQCNEKISARGRIGKVPPLNAARQMAACAYLARQLGTDPAPVSCGTLTLQPRQVCSALRCVGSGSSKTTAVSAGWKKPGPIALQVMLCRPYFGAIARVTCSTPPMPAPWGALPAYARQRCSDALWTTRPQPRAFTRGGGAWVITDRAPPGKYTSSRSSLLPDPTRSMGNRCP